MAARRDEVDLRNPEREGLRNLGLRGLIFRMSDRARDLDRARMLLSSSLRVRDLDLALLLLRPSSPFFLERDLDRADSRPETLGSRGALRPSSASLALSLGSRLLLRAFLIFSFSFSFFSGPRDLLLALPWLLVDLRLETLVALLFVDLLLDTDLDRTGVRALISATGGAGPSSVAGALASDGAAPPGSLPPGSPPRLFDLPCFLMCLISAS